MYVTFTHGTQILGIELDLVILNISISGEMFGRALRVNFAKPMKITEGSTRPVWASDEWLQVS